MRLSRLGPESRVGTAGKGDRVPWLDVIVEPMCLGLSNLPYGEARYVDSLRLCSETRDGMAAGNRRRMRDHQHDDAGSECGRSGGARPKQRATCGGGGNAD